MTNVEIFERLSEYAAGLFALCNDIAADIDNYENRAQQLRAEFLTRLRNKEERQNINEEGHAVFILPDKEVKLLSKKLKKAFSSCGYKLLATRREDTGVWEIRKQIEGIKLYASSTDLDEAKRKFTEKLHNYAKNGNSVKKDRDFCGYLLNFMETVKRLAVKDITYRAYLNAYKLYILPYFKGKNITAITREDCQAFINSFAEKQRTAQIAYQLISVAFRFAVQDDLISKSPMALVKLPPREQVHGNALTYTEEKELVRLCMQNIAIPAIQAVLFVLYTGIRRSELASATINENFVIVENAKLRKGRRQTARNIPITPMLRKVLPLITPQAFLTSADTLTRMVKKILPLHHCHELRHTFISRCKECEVLPEVVSIWAGHTLNGTVTTTVHTHYSENFMLKEAAKVNYAI